MRIILHLSPLHCPLKEGNSLTSLTANLYCLEKKPQMIETLHMVARAYLHKPFPSLVAEHPQNMIGLRGGMLSDVFVHATKLYILPKHRFINEIRTNYFEKSCGMNKPSKTFCIGRLVAWACLVVLSAAL